MSIFSDLNIKNNLDEVNASFNRAIPAMIITDVSGSMDKYSVQIRRNILSLVKKLKENTLHNNNVMLSVMVFNSSHNTLVDMQRLREIDEKVLEKKLNDLKFKGRTHTGRALQAAFKDLNDILEVQRNEGRRFYKPLMFLITDGNPNYTSFSDHEEEDQLLEKSYDDILAFQKKGFFYVVSVGSNVDKDILDRLAGKGSPLVITEDPEDIAELFEAVTDTIDKGAGDIDRVDNSTLNDQYESIKKRSTMFEEDV